MAFSKEIIDGFNRMLKGYGFIQKGTSEVFIYDCGWYCISVKLIKSGSVYVINTGIHYLWDNTVYVHSIHGEGTQYDNEPQLSSIEDECVRINTRKEYLLKIYQNPQDMIPYFKKFDDYPHQPHGYFIARIFENKTETEYFKKILEGIIDAYNKPPYLGDKDKRGKYYPIFEQDILNIFKMDNEEFKNEIIKRINGNRKKYKLKILEKYF
jgi:hypothetical protein